MMQILRLENYEDTVDNDILFGWMRMASITVMIFLLKSFFTYPLMIFLEQ
jgi:hypothetical protein